MASPTLASRVAALEQELAKLKSRIEGGGSESPWWERIAGTFAEDEMYQRAMELGREYRQSLRSDRTPPKK